MNLPEPYYKTDLGILYCGDCLEIMPHLPKVGKTEFVCITDPPYGCKATTGRGGVYDKFKIVGDDTTYSRDWLIDFISYPAIIFGSPRTTRPKCKSVLIWSKGPHTGMGDLSFPWKPDFEEIYVIGGGWKGRRTSSVLQFNARIDSSRFHPTEKPTALMEELIKKSPPGIILDPFLGSGTTAIACERLGRRWIGIEISETYAKIAKERIEKEVNQLKLFPVEVPEPPKQETLF